MFQQDQSVPTLRRPRTRRRLAGSIVALLAALLIGVIAWRALGGRTPSATEFVASDEFKNLPTEEKGKWVEAVEKEMRPDGKQEKMLRNLAQARMQKLLDDYFAIPEGKARTKYLDDRIEEQEQLRKMIDTPSTQPGRIVIKRGGTSAADQKDMAESMPAEYQAKMAQYVKDIKARRAERGLPTEGVPMGMMIRVNK